MPTTDAPQRKTREGWGPYGDQPARKIIRFEQGRTISWVAKQIGMRDQDFRNMLHGMRDLSPEQADALVELLGRPESELFTEAIQLRLYALRALGDDRP